MSETPDLRAALAAWLRSRPNDAEAETQLVLAAREWLDEATPEPAPAGYCCPCCDAGPGHKPCPTPEPAPAVLDRYRAIIEDTARWLETETPESFDGQRIALTLRHWLDDPADFDKYAGMAGALRALTATPSEATDG